MFTTVYTSVRPSVPAVLIVVQAISHAAVRRPHPQQVFYATGPAHTAAAATTTRVTAAAAVTKPVSGWYGV